MTNDTLASALARNPGNADVRNLVSMVEQLSGRVSRLEDVARSAANGLDCRAEAKVAIGWVAPKPEEKKVTT